MQRGHVAAVEVLFWIILTGCSDGTAPTPSLHADLRVFRPRPMPQPPVVPSRDGPIQLLDLVTYDGSGQVVHPAPTMTPKGWSANRFHLAATPYPGGNVQFENPSVYVGDSPLQWNIPDGVTNPIEQPEENGYLSDPSQLYDPETNELFLYYRQVTTVNTILLVHSPDGVHWSTPQVVLTVASHTAVSPAVVRRGPGDWWMWVVNGGPSGCSGPAATVDVRQSTDGVTWSDPRIHEHRVPVRADVRPTDPAGDDVVLRGAIRQYGVSVANRDRANERVDTVRHRRDTGCSPQGVDTTE